LPGLDGVIGEAEFAGLAFDKGFAFDQGGEHRRDAGEEALLDEERLTRRVFCPDMNPKEAVWRLVLPAANLAFPMVPLAV
jgi:hypothetical protein